MGIRINTMMTTEYDSIIQWLGASYCLVPIVIATTGLTNQRYLTWIHQLSTNRTRNPLTRHGAKYQCSVHKDCQWINMTWNNQTSWVEGCTMLNVENVDMNGNWHWLNLIITARLVVQDVVQTTGAPVIKWNQKTSLTSNVIIFNDLSSLRNLYYTDILTQIMSDWNPTCEACDEESEGSCEDCHVSVCDEHWCLMECSGSCDGYVCMACAKSWRGEPYCDDCYVFPHDWPFANPMIRHPSRGYRCIGPSVSLIEL